MRSGSEADVPASRRIERDDVLLVRATAEAVHRAEVELALGVLPVEGGDGGNLSQALSRELGVGEVLIAPRSCFA